MSMKKGRETDLANLTDVMNQEERQQEQIRVALSEMVEGARAYHPGLGVVVELRSGGLAGGAECDLYLATVCDIREWKGEELPDVIVDTDMGAV